MPTAPTSNSPYRQLEREFQKNEDGFWEALQERKYDDPSICLGWAINFAQRMYNLNQTEIAEKVGITKSHITAGLSGHTRISPEIYLNISRVCGISPIHFGLAEKWYDFADVAAFNMPESQLAQPILAAIMEAPVERRPSVIAVVLSVLDTVSRSEAAAAAAATK